MKWRILGPVNGTVEGRPLAIRRPQQLAALAFLLLNANLVVSTGQLVQALWADRPPASARTQVHGCLSQLRRVLRRAGFDELLISVAGGYRLAVADDMLDLTTFTNGVATARAAAAVGDPRLAAEVLRAALGSWCGAALTGAVGAFVPATAAGLHEQRLAATEQLADAELALGRHAAVVALLRPLAQANPLRERTIGQLMLALTGCGRQGEALHLYADTRSRLADELGCEPAAELATVHLRVLRQQVPMAAIPAPTAFRAPVTPAQLPANVARFSGRSGPLRQLDALMPQTAAEEAGAPTIAVIAGMAGSGKTTLALRWAHQSGHRFPDGQLFVDLHGFGPTERVVGAGTALPGFLGALGVRPSQTPSDLEAQVGLYRSLVAGRRLLIVLDNARDAAQIRPLLPGSPGCVVVVTSRDQLGSLVAAEGAHVLTLSVLTPAEAWDLLAGRLGVERVAAEPDAVAEIIDRCASLPLALAVVAARASTYPDFPLAALAAELRVAPGRLDGFDGGGAITDLRTVFSWSYRTLTAPAARLFRRLGLHRGPEITASGAAVLLGTDTDRVRAPLAELTRSHLLTERAPGLYTVHGLLHAYAGELAYALDSQQDRDAAVLRLLDHHLCAVDVPGQPARPAGTGLTTCAGG